MSCLYTGMCWPILRRRVGCGKATGCGRSPSALASSATARSGERSEVSVPSGVILAARILIRLHQPFLSSMLLPLSVHTLSAELDHVHKQQAGTTWRQSTHCLGASGTCTCTDACVNTQHFCSQQRQAGGDAASFTLLERGSSFQNTPTCIFSRIFKGRV